MKNNFSQNNKGLNQDIEPSLQPEGSSRFRLNALPETKEGELGFMPNEAGNKICYNLTSGYYPIGQIPILDDKEVIFSVNPTLNKSEIGIVQNCVYSILINSDCLNFNIKNQIRGIFRVREGCNTNLYFTDFLNPYRAIDIDNIGQYLVNQDSSIPVATRISSANADGLGWDCNSFKLFRDYDQSNIDMQVFNTGGILNVGMYQFTYQYLDEDFNPQPWITPSNPIPIYKDSLNEYTGLDGDVTGTVTNKSIQLTLNNLDSRYAYVRIGLIVSDFGTGFNSNAYILEELSIEDNTINYLFQGIDPNKTQNTDLESFTFLPPAYYTGKDLNQIDNSLVLAYPKARDIDWTPFIQAVLEIQSTYYIRDLFAEQTGQDSYGNRYPNSYYYNKSLMRDEVYAFGLVPIFDDGTEGPAFHIPARALNTKSNGTNIVSVDYDSSASADYNLHNRLSPITDPDIVGNAGQWDDCLYDAIASNIDANIINSSQVNNNQVERWKIFNTAIRTSANWITDPSTPNHEYRVEGELAYWESQDYTYPDITDCSGVSVYGDLSGQPVRYHKMPDATLEPHYWGYSTTSNPHTDGFAYIRPLSVKFDNINLPAIDGVAGYRIVRVERNTYNSSVIDKGLMLEDVIYEGFGTNSAFEGRTQGFPFSTNIDAINLSFPTSSGIDNFVTSPGLQEKSLHTPKTKILKDSIQGDYIKFERSIWDNNITVYSQTNGGDQGVSEELLRVYYDEAVDKNFLLSKARTVKYGLGTRYNDNYIPVANTGVNYTNRIINKQSYIPANALVADGVERPYFANCQTETFAIDLEENILPSMLGTQISADWNNIGLGFPTTNVFSVESPTFLNITTENFRTCGYYTSLKRYLPNQYNGIHQVVYSCPGKFDSTTSYLYNNGDCFINDWGFKKYGEFTQDLDTFQQFSIVFNAYYTTVGDEPEKLSMRSILRMWCESPINMELRDGTNEQESSYYTDSSGSVGGQGDTNNLIKWYYPKNYNETKVNVNDFLSPEVAWDNNRFGTVRNWYSYNKDFSIENTIRSFFPLPINYDFCNECLVKYPHRLANSNKAYQEERADNYRIFLPNNYRDIPGETGSINEIFIKDNKLFIHTTQSLWYQQVKPQQIKTDQATLYVGTGEFWEIPPNEIMTSLNGYAGCQHQVGTINTPFGYFYPSERERKVFLFNDKLTEISNLGLRNWFENNLPLQLIAQNPNLNIPSDNPANPSGVGFLVAYDKRHRRIIFSKKDFLVLDTETTTYSDATNNWVYRPDPRSAELQIINLGDITYFENKSWTISYYPDTNTWVSWHSYLPTFMYNNQNNHFTFSNQYLSSIDNYVGPTVAYIHNIEYDTTTDENNFQRFYTQTYPYINEFTFNKEALSMNLYPNISWYSIASEYNDTTDTWSEIQDTFDEAIIYNDYQSTGDLELIQTTNPFQTIVQLPANQSYIERTERKWNINRYRNYNTAQPIWRVDWNSLSNDYFIDKIPANIDLTKNIYQLDKFRDTYLTARLVYNNENNRKLLNKFIYNTQKISPR